VKNLLYQEKRDASLPQHDKLKYNIESLFNLNIHYGKMIKTNISLFLTNMLFNIPMKRMEYIKKNKKI